MPGPSGERCDTCYLWEPPESQTATPDEFGKCRFQLLLIDREGHAVSAFPKIKGYGWCGNWKPLISQEVVETTREWTDK